MERGVSDRNILDKFADDFCSITNKHVRYIVVSGYVAISHGRFRTTEDIDMIIEKIGFERFIIFHNDLIKNGFICLQSIENSGDVVTNSPEFSKGQFYKTDNTINRIVHTKPEDIYDYLQKGDGIRYVREGTFLPPEMEIHFAKDEIDELQLATRKKMPFTGLDIWFSSIEMNIAFKEELLKGPKDVEDAQHLGRIYKGEIDEKFIEEIKEKIGRLRVKK